MATEIVKIKQFGRVYSAKIAGYRSTNSHYILAEKPDKKDLLGIRIVQQDGSVGMILPKECLNYEQLPDNLLQ